MRRRSNRSCTYAVALDSKAGNGEVQELANYLSSLHLAECEVLVLDDCGVAAFDDRDRILRWVAQHVAVLPHQRFSDGSVDVLQAATELAATDKLIIASTDARYTAADVRSICELLDRHEVVEPEEYVDPLPWWGGFDAGRILLHRGVDQTAHVRSTFALRRTSFRPLRGFDERPVGNCARRLLMQGAEVHEAHNVFVRREPRPFGAWLRERPREASADLATPMKSALFLAAVPLLAVLAVIGGTEMAGGYAGVMAFASIMLAVRGRAGAGKFFPMRACLFAPLWICERSLSLYWALFDRLRIMTSASDVAVGSLKSEGGARSAKRGLSA
ncbi:MAG TPA: hypothetical protein VF980_01660 [Thermoanaerobaculia bacterium]